MFTKDLKNQICISKRKDTKTNVKEHIATKLLITWQMIPLKYFIKITEKNFMFCDCYQSIPWSYLDNRQLSRKN